MKTIMVTVSLLLGFMSLAFIYVEDAKVKRMVFVQVNISIFCSVTYGFFLKNFEKSKKMHFENR